MHGQEQISFIEAIFLNGLKVVVYSKKNLEIISIKLPLICNNQLLS